MESESLKSSFLKTVWDLKSKKQTWDRPCRWNMCTHRARITNVLSSSSHPFYASILEGKKWRSHRKRARAQKRVNSVQSLIHVRLFATPQIAARQASLSITNSQSSLRLERLLLNHANTPGFLAPGGEEFNPGLETRLDHSELLCNKVLLKYKGDRESFWHRHQKGAERVPPC